MSERHAQRGDVYWNSRTGRYVVIYSRPDWQGWQWVSIAVGGPMELRYGRWKRVPAHCVLVKETG